MPPQNPLERGPKPPLPRQHQNEPGLESAMNPRPDYGQDSYRGSGNLTGKAALITGGDSGIGRAVALAFAMEGADVAIAYNHSEGDAAETRRLVERHGRRCLALMADVTVEADRARLVAEKSNTTRTVQTSPVQVLCAASGRGTYCRSGQRRTNRSFSATS